MIALIKLIVQLLAMAMLVFCVITVGSLGHWGLASVIMLCAFVVSL